MDQPYSFLADCLAKFHASSDPIKALWLIATLTATVGVALCLTRAAREIAGLFAKRAELQGDMLYAIYRAPDGRWLVYAKGKVSDLTAPDCPEPSAALQPWRP